MQGPRNQQNLTLTLKKPIQYIITLIYWISNYPGPGNEQNYTLMLISSSQNIIACILALLLLTLLHL